MPGHVRMSRQKRNIRRLVSMTGEVYLECASREFHGAVMYEEGCAEELFCC